MSNNIDPELRAIKNNIYGHDIRMAIHDAIEKLWDLAESKEPETPFMVYNNISIPPTLAAVGFVANISTE